MYVRLVCCLLYVPFEIHLVSGSSQFMPINLLSGKLKLNVSACLNIWSSLLQEVFFMELVACMNMLHAATLSCYIIYSSEHNPFWTEIACTPAKDSLLIMEQTLRFSWKTSPNHIQPFLASDFPWCSSHNRYAAICHTDTARFPDLR